MAKGRISKRVYQENEARQIFRKKNISYPLIRTRTWLVRIRGIGNVPFSENLACFAFLLPPFEICPFALLQTKSAYITACNCSFNISCSFPKTLPSWKLLSEVSKFYLSTKSMKQEHVSILKCQCWLKNFQSKKVKH